MARIKIADLPIHIKTSKEEMKMALGGYTAPSLWHDRKIVLSGGIMPGHLYTGVTTFTDSNGKEYVALRNPWGQPE